MLYIPLAYLRPGMVLARDILSGLEYACLLPAGHAVTQANIDRIRELNIAGVYIKSEHAQGLDVQEFVDIQTKREVIGDVNKLFKEYSASGNLSTSSVTNLYGAAEKLVSCILNKDTCLLNIIELKDFDSYTFTHSFYVGLLSTLMGVHLKLPTQQITMLTLAGLLHDIGKLDIPITIINKPAALTNTEFNAIKQHPNFGCKKLRKSLKLPPKVIEGVESHHEKYDGTGYPKGLKGEEIPLFGRIIAICDVYDALTSSRPYRTACSPNEAIEFLMGNAGSQFDYNLLSAFFQIITAYPLGMLVELSNGSIGVVVNISQYNLLRPVVRLIKPDENLGQEIDLSNIANLNITIIGQATSAIDLLTRDYN